VRSAADLKCPKAADCRCGRSAALATIASRIAKRAVRVVNLLASEPERDAAVKRLKLWAPPAFLLASWMLAAALTLSELATIPASLHTPVERPTSRASKQGAVEARAHASNRPAIAR
jgi:hypothetical protein